MAHSMPDADAVAKVTIPVRLDEAIVERIDAVAAGLSKRASGVDVNRSQAIRVVIEAGLKTLESDLGAFDEKRGKGKR